MGTRIAASLAPLRLWLVALDAAADVVAAGRVIAPVESTAEPESVGGGALMTWRVVVSNSRGADVTLNEGAAVMPGVLLEVFNVDMVAVALLIVKYCDSEEALDWSDIWVVEEYCSWDAVAAVLESDDKVDRGYDEYDADGSPIVESCVAPLAAGIADGVVCTEFSDTGLLFGGVGVGKAGGLVEVVNSWLV